MSVSPNPKKNSEASLVGSTLCTLSHVRGRAAVPSVTLQRDSVFYFSWILPPCNPLSDFHCGIPCNTL